MIEKLTKEEERKIPEFVEKYRAIGLSTKNPSKKRAFEIIDRLYKLLDKPAPQKFYVDSPATALNLYTELSGNDDTSSQIPNIWYGSFYAHCMSFYSFIAEMDGINIGQYEENLKVANEMLELGCTLAYDSVCIVSKKPKKIIFEDGKLHCSDGPAVEYPDGYALYSWRGISVKKEWIEDPNSITVEEVLAEQNAEKRRSMIEIMGYGRYLKEANSKLIDKHIRNGRVERLWESDFGYKKAKIIEVINATPENDGTYKHYFFQVPSRINSAAEAVASLYGLDPDEYNPTVET